MMPWTPTYGQTDHLVSTFDELLKEMLEPIQSKGQLVHGQLDDHTFDLGRGVWKYTVNGGDRIGNQCSLHVLWKRCCGPPISACHGNGVAFALSKDRKA